MGPWRVHLVLLATQVIFATLPIAAKLVLHAVEPMGLAMLRIAGAALLFLLVHLVRSGAIRIARRDLLPLIGLSLSGVVLNQLLFLEGVQRTTAIHTNIIITIIPVMTLGLAMLLGRERGTTRKVGGILLAGAGAIGLALARGGAPDGSSLLGDSLILANSACYAVYLVFSRDVLRRVPPLTLVTSAFLMACLLAAPVGAPALVRTRTDLLTGSTLAVLAYIVLFPSFLVYLTSIWALKRAPSSLVATYIYVQPVVTAFVAPVVLGERMTVKAVLASFVIFAGLALATWGVSESRVTAQTPPPPSDPLPGTSSP